MAAASIKSREATEEPQTGWSLTRHVSQTHSEASLGSDHPVPRLFSERIHFANGASTPPLQGGECTYAKSVSNMKWDTTLVYGRTWPVAEATQIHVVLNWLEELKQRGACNWPLIGFLTPYLDRKRRSASSSRRSRLASRTACTKTLGFSIR